MVSRNPKKSSGGKKILSLILVVLLAIVGYFYESNYNPETEKNVDWSTVTTVTPTETPVTYSEVPKIDSKKLQIYFLDVGQADSIFITNNGENMLIDAGNNEDGKLVVDFLKSMNITKIDYLIGTHPHEDHIGGLDDVINEMDIGKIFMPKKSSTTKTFKDVLTAISNKNLKVKAPKVGDKFNVGNAVCEVMSIENDADNANEASIVIEMTYGSQKFLFTGDMETNNEKARDWNDIDVLKVAHHGSRTSSSKLFLSQTLPEVAVISLGKDNDYGHPHEEVVKRLENVEATIYRTDERGTILLVSDGEENEIQFLAISCDGNAKEEKE